MKELAEQTRDRVLINKVKTKHNFAIKAGSFSQIGTLACLTKNDAYYDNLLNNK